MLRLPAFLLLLLVPALTYAQDTILKKSGEEMPAKVLRITPEQVTYLQGTDTLRMAAAEIFLIRYANGTKEVLGGTSNASRPVAPLTAAEAEALGRSDAYKLFKAKGAFWGTYGATVVTTPVYFLGGIGTGAAIAASNPRPDNVITSSPELKQNPEYMRGYNTQAKKRKLGKAAAGFGAGVATGVVAIVVVVMVAFSQIY